jgi:hypothetical protein
MTFVLKLGTVAVVAAFGWITVLYFNARAAYRDGLRRAFDIPSAS